VSRCFGFLSLYVFEQWHCVTINIDFKVTGLFRVTTCLENLEMSGNLTAASEMSGILLKISELSGKKSCQGKVA